MLPDMSGLDVLRKLRETNPEHSGAGADRKDALEDRIAGLTAGGDDYVTKPFSIEEVVLRLRACCVVPVSRQLTPARRSLSAILCSTRTATKSPRGRIGHVNVDGVRTAALPDA